MSVIGEGGVLLTIDDVRRWVVERAKLSHDIDDLQEKIDDLDRRLSLVDDILGAEKRKALFGEWGADKSAQREVTGFGSWVMDLLRKSNAALTLSEIRSATEGGEYEDRARRNSNLVYNTVKRLELREFVVKNGSSVVAVDVYEKLVNDGKEPFNTEALSNDLSAPAVVQNILSSKEGGMVTAELLRAMRLNSSLAEKINRNPQYGYTILSRMLKRGQIDRRDNVYYAK